jgi:single-strand DNA-binding protein
MIKLQIVGNLGKDCIVKEVNGKNVINFSVAHTERYKDAQGNQKERTTWVECAYWTDKTTVAQYLTKGKMVYAEGSPEADGYLNKEQQPAATLRMRVSNLQLLGGANADGSPNTGASNQSGYASSAPSVAAPASQPPAAALSTASSEADDLPF